MSLCDHPHPNCLIRHITFQGSANLPLPLPPLSLHPPLFYFSSSLILFLSLGASLLPSPLPSPLHLPPPPSSPFPTVITFPHYVLSPKLSPPPFPSPVSIKSFFRDFSRNLVHSLTNIDCLWNNVFDFFSIFPLFMCIRIILLVILRKWNVKSLD